MKHNFGTQFIMEQTIGQTQVAEQFHAGVVEHKVDVALLFLCAHRECTPVCTVTLTIREHLRNHRLAVID
jgi:hypothetical protein